MSVFKRLDHVSIGVKDMAKAKSLMTDIFGAEALGDAGTSPEGFHWATFRLGGKKVELVSPAVPGEGGVGRYIEKRGEGYHHISISVENLERAIEYFKSKGIGVLAPNFDNPKWRHCYLNPKDTFGAMIQVFEENEETAAQSGDAPAAP